MIRKAISYAVFCSLALLSLGEFGPAACASTLTVSTSGQFGADVVADQLAVPMANCGLSFDVDVTAANNADALGFDATFTDFNYMLNGSAIAVAPAEIRFYTGAGGGLFTLFFGPETGFENGVPIPEFTFSGDQAFSGTTIDPTILTGSYSILVALCPRIAGICRSDALLNL